MKQVLVGLACRSDAGPQELHGPKQCPQVRFCPSARCKRRGHALVELRRLECWSGFLQGIELILIYHVDGFVLVGMLSRFTSHPRPFERWRGVLWLR